MRGLQRGFEMAGRYKGLSGDSEEVVVESIAHVAADLILAGQGRDALVILVQAAPKSEDGEGEEGGHKSPLVRALERLPGMVPGPQSSQSGPDDGANAVIPAIQARGATHPQSVVPSGQPFFTPQRQLLPADLDAPEASRARDLTRGPGRPGHPLPPGSPLPLPSTPLNAGNFEKNSPAKAGAE